MWKRSIALLLALVTLLGITACGGGDAKAAEVKSEEVSTKTVYLRTSETISTPTQRVTNKHEYDFRGNLCGYSYRHWMYAESEGFTSTSDSFLSFSFEYDNTSKIKRVVVDADGKMKIFDANYSNGLLTEYFGEVYGESDEKYITISFTHDKNGDIVSGEKADDEGYSHKMVSIKYRDDRTVEERVAYGSGSITTKKYNEAGRLAEEYTYNSTFLNSSQSNYQYDDKGRVTYRSSAIDNYAYDDSFWEQSYTYDKENRISGISGNTDGVSYECSGSWDEENRTMTLTYDDGHGDVMIKRAYDEMNNVICETYYEDGDFIYEYTYSYIALQLPTDYVAPDLDDPRFLMQFQLTY